MDIAAWKKIKMKITNIFDIILKQHKKEKSKYSVFLAWPQIITEAFNMENSYISNETITYIVNSSKLYDIINDKVIVEVQHPGWRQILLTKQNEILEIIHNQYNIENVKTIQFILPKTN